MSVPNQKKIRIATRTKRNKDNLYAMMNIDALQAAVCHLKGSALKMWLYFNKNQDNFELGLSQKACAAWGIKKDSYYDGVEELIKKRYLLPTHWGSNVYYFYESPKPEDPNEIKTKPFGEISNRSANLEKKESENPERNNTNNIKDNTKIIQEKSDTADGGIAACSASASKTNEDRFAHLSEEKRQHLLSLGF